jgi:hypothetical protein
MMHNVQMVWHKRVKVLSSFTSRLRYFVMTFKNISPDSMANKITHHSIAILGIAHLALLPSFVHSNDVSCL